jgi:hypothetical protein
MEPEYRDMDAYKQASTAGASITLGSQIIDMMNEWSVLDVKFFDEAQWVLI